MATLVALPTWKIQSTCRTTDEMCTAAVHAAFESAANMGMLGLLGETWALIVVDSDKPRVDACYNLAEECYG